MALNTGGIVKGLNKLGLFELVDTHVDAFFILDGKKYEIEHFQISFQQGVDHKGQPQNETRGGQISITLTQAVSDGIYDWAKRNDKRKNGSILFKSQTMGTVLEVAFVNGNCIRLTRSVSSMTGTKTSLTISSEKTIMGRVTHDNKWRE